VLREKVRAVRRVRVIDGIVDEHVQIVRTSVVAEQINLLQRYETKVKVAQESQIQTSRQPRDVEHGLRRHGWTGAELCRRGMWRVWDAEKSLTCQGSPSVADWRSRADSGK
jgi:hypothetical protein